ncbi:MAG TPA: SsrA-binding protein SmpB [Candidatus Paceibacterota bacterium]
MNLVENKKAYFNYEILEKLEAGIELLGFEVKSLRKGQGSLDGSHVTIHNNETYLINATVSPYQPANTPKDYEPRRNRKLLLTKKEISQLIGTEKQKGLTIVPLAIYSKGPKLKVSLGIVRGKKKFDKRQSIKKRESERDSRRILKYE